MNSVSIHNVCEHLIFIVQYSKYCETVFKLLSHQLLTVQSLPLNSNLIAIHQRKCVKFMQIVSRSYRLKI